MVTSPDPEKDGSNDPAISKVTFFYPATYVPNESAKLVVSASATVAFIVTLFNSSSIATPLKLKLLSLPCLRALLAPF